jgi:acetyl esterase/lipase
MTKQADFRPRIIIIAVASGLSLLFTISSPADPVNAAVAPAATQTDQFLKLTSIPLWEGAAPQAVGDLSLDRPTLYVFRPFGRPNGTAVIIAPGGAYLGLAADLEGRQVADWFASRGVTAFVLKYRLGARYPLPVPLLDAQRAIRLVRSQVKVYDLAPNRIGMMGFSAGGHLSALAGTTYDVGNSQAPDLIDRESSRPDFLILAYPALIMFAPANNSAIGYCNVIKIGAACDEAYLAQFRPENHVDARTPPAFIYHTTDDALVPVDDSLRFFRALTVAGVPAELHVFAHGAHGSGLGLGDPALMVWPNLLDQWLRGRGLMAPNPNPVRIAGAAIPVVAKQKFSIDTPLAELVTNPDAKVVLVANLDGAFSESLPEAISKMSLRQIASQYGAPDDVILASIQKALATVRSH